MKWPEVNIAAETGPTTAVAPLIVSASRSTDIPAFYADWFMNRLRKGYVKWVNPFNRKPQYVSFERTRAIVFWSKNPKPLIQHIEELNQRRLAYYFQFTLNDYETEGLEPCVPSLQERVRTFISLANIVGEERIIWRFDPLILLEGVGVRGLLRKIERLGEQIASYTRRFVFSFADISSYRKVESNLRRHGVRYCEFTDDTIQEVSAGIALLCARWGLQARTCAEQVDLSQFGIEHNKCVDDELLLRISGNDPTLCAMFRPRSTESGLFGADLAESGSLKDPGQRKECGCIFSKDIGQYDTCRHLCRYCYANTSERVVCRNAANMTPDGDCIVS